jgi:hypothetical protein
MLDLLCYVCSLLIHNPEQPVVCTASYWQHKKGTDVIIDLLLLICGWTNTRTTNSWTGQNLVFCLTYFQRLVLPFIYCADRITWYLCCIQLWSARSGHCLVQVGTARQRYICSKNIYFFGNRSALSVVTKVLLLRLYFVCFIRISFC